MTITRGFGFALDTQTGHVERWAFAGEPTDRPSGSQCAQCGMPGGGHKMQCGERAHERGLVIPAVLIDGEYRVTHRPSGRTCAQCQHTARDCSRLDFASMHPAGGPDADGVQRVACSGYVRAGIPTLDECRVIAAPLIEDIKRRTGHPPGMLQEGNQ